MIFDLVDDEGKVFINPQRVLYAGPVDDNVTLIMLNGGQGFVVAESFDAVVARWTAVSPL